MRTRMAYYLKLKTHVYQIEGVIAWTGVITKQAGFSA